MSVEITGVPTASDSTTPCGKFSHAEERSDASAARKSSSTRSRGCAPRKRDLRPGARASSCARSGPSPTTSRRTSGTRLDRGERDLERLLARQAAGEDERRAVDAVAGAELLPRGHVRGTGGAGFGTTVTRSGATPQPIASSRRYADGQTTWAARRSSSVAREAERADPEAARARAGTRPCRRRRGRGGAPARRRGRRGASRRTASAPAWSRASSGRASRSRRSTSALRACSATTRTTWAWRTPGGSERATQCTVYGCFAGAWSAVVTTSAAMPRERSQPGELRRVARRPADVGRPDPGDDQHLHRPSTCPASLRAGTSTSTAAPHRPRLIRA